MSFLDIQDILDNNLWDDSHLFQDLNDSINTSEMARRKFRDIAVYFRFGFYRNAQ